MPEFYVEPMKDRKCCSVCKKTAKEKGKKVLLTCIKCHAITYCGVECQKEDWERHEWNCVPVMVTEIPGKGRGLVAATDIEQGELIFQDEPAIKLAVDTEGHPVDPGFMTSLKEQIESLPTEAKSQYYKLTTGDAATTTNYHASRSDNEVLKLFLFNSKTYIDTVGKGDERASVLHLNIALVNHSCAPSAHCDILKQEGAEDLSFKLRALKNIRKGEEITVCYYLDVQKFGSIPRKRKTAFKKDLAFDCKCPVCLGNVPFQEKILKKLIELHIKLNPTASDWKREAGLWSRIVDLTMELNIGHPSGKGKVLASLAGFAHLARDKDLVKKAMDILRKYAKEIKGENIQRNLEELENWFREFNSNSAPEKREIDFILSALA